MVNSQQQHEAGPSNTIIGSPHDHYARTNSRGPEGKSATQSLKEIQGDKSNHQKSMPSHFTNYPNPLQQSLRRIQPQKILQRGVKSAQEGISLPAVRINSEPIISARNQRTISSSTNKNPKNPHRNTAVINAVSKSNIPLSLEKPAGVNVPNRKESDFIFQAKEKGLLSNGPTRKGPYNSKYK